MWYLCKLRFWNIMVVYFVFDCYYFFIVKIMIESFIIRNRFVFVINLWVIDGSCFNMVNLIFVWLIERFVSLIFYWFIIN